MKSFFTDSHTIRRHLVSFSDCDISRLLAVVDSGRVAIVRILQSVKTINTSCPLSHGSTSYRPINRLVNTDRQGEITSGISDVTDSFVSRLCRELINVHKAGLLHSPKAWEIFKLQYCTSGRKIEQIIPTSCIKFKNIFFFYF